MNKRIHMGRGLLAAALLSAGGALAFLPGVAGASTPKPQINVVTSHAGTHTVKLGHPQVASGAKLSPGYIAYNPANGDEALETTAATGTTHVYLIAGANEANEYNIVTGFTGASTTTPVHGSLVKGDAYLLAGTGTAGIVARPGTGSTPALGETPSAAAVTNPIAPQSLAFDNSGNLLLGEALPTTGATQTGIQFVAKTSCAATCAYGFGHGGFPAVAAGGLYTVAATGTVAGSTATPAISFTFQVEGFGLAVDSTGNIVTAGNGFAMFLNEQAGTVARYGKSLAHHKATVIAGTTLGSATCGGGSVNVPSTGTSSANLQWTRPTLDSGGNVYLNDNRGSGSVGCAWVLPASSGTLNSSPVSAGRLYSLTGAVATTGAANGAVANAAGLKTAQAIVPDKAGNVVIAQGGTSTKLWVVAESTTVWYGQSMTKGHIYLVCGGGTTLTTPTTCTKFKFAGLPRVTTLPNRGITSLAQGAAGHLVVSNSSTATNGAAYTVTGAPTGPPSAVVTSVAPTSGSTNGNTVVTIHGRNLAGTTLVKFGGTDATTVTNVATTVVTAKTASHAAGLVTVAVTAALGTGTKATAFTYVAPATTHVSLTVSPSGTVYTGTTVTITAHVTPNTVAGHVKFFDGSTVLGTVAVSSGVAHYSTTSLAAGTHHLHATFTPTTQTTFMVSTSSTTTLKVTTHPTTGGNVIQQFGQTVKAGFLTLNCLHPEVTDTPSFQTCPIIDFTQITLNGTTQTRTKPMNPLYVLTARGTPTSGWALSVSMVPTAHTLQTNTSCWGLADFCDSSIGSHALDPNLHGQIAAKHLTLGSGYTCLPQTTNTNPQPAAETHGTFGRGGSATANSQYAGTMALCQAPHGTSGGIFKVSGANYTLTVPPTAYHGLYFGTVEYTLVSI
jgi:hypothetical protein